MKSNFPALPDWEIQVKSPGRVNLLGEHVDYNQGMVLPAAIDRFVHLAARPLAERQVKIQALDLEQTVRFSLDSLDERVDENGERLPNWAVYAAGVAWALREHGLEVNGLQAMVTSNLPMGAGLSSSAALELAFALAWQAVGGWQIERMQLALICQRAENHYVGVNCGLMDQFACAHGVARHALFFDTRHLIWRPLPMPPKTAIVIADSGIQRQLANSAYNQRRQACEKAVADLKQVLPNIRALRDVSPQQLRENVDRLDETTFRRALHVVNEIERVQQACVCLENEDTPAFGRLLVESHRSLRDLFEASLAELDFLVETALQMDGCYGARLTGAGFGGCTVNLVRQECAQDFIDYLRDAYQRQFGRQTAIFSCQPSRGTHIVGK